jgi:hypothetical protein
MGLCCSFFLSLFFPTLSMSSFLVTYLCIYIDLLYYHVRRYHDKTKRTSFLRWNKADIIAWNYTCHWTKGTKRITLSSRNELVCSFGVSNFCSVGLVAPVVLQVISHERGRKTGLSLRQTEKWAETILYFYESVYVWLRF